MANQLYRVTTLVVMAFMVVGCGKKEETLGSGEYESEMRSVQSFNKIHLNGAGTLLVKKGDEESLKIEADDNVLKYIRSEVSGNTLELEMKPGIGHVITPVVPVKYSVTVRELEEVVINGAARFETQGTLPIKKFELEINGSAKAFVDLEGDKFETEIRGSGDVIAKGNVRSQEIQISGVAKYDGSQLESRKASIEIRGAGQVIVNVSDELDVDIAGGGSVSYIGKPKVSQRVSGAGKITAIEKDDNKG